MSERFEKHAFTFTLLTFLSRLTGLARDASMSRIFGNGALMDAFGFAFLIPNLFRRLFGEGALSAAFLPVYAKLQKDQPAVASQLATLAVSLLIVALGGITLLGEAVLAFLMSESGGGGGGGGDHLALRLMMIMLPYMPLVCLVAVLGAMLQVHGRFRPTAASPIILNACIVAGAVGLLWWFDQADPAQERMHLSLVAGSVLLAGVLQVGWSLWALRGSGWWAGSWRACREARPALRQVLVQVWPMLLGLGVLQVNTFLDAVIASYPTTFGPTIFGIDFPLESGALASLNNAQRLYEFPLGVFGIAVATAIFPALSRLADDGEKFRDTLRRGLRLVIYIGLPASAGLMLVREPATAVILQGGDFAADDTRRVAFVLLGYAPAIWAYSMTHTLTRAFYARGDSRTPVRVAVGMVGLNLALNLTLIWTPLKEAGLAWSTAICAIVQVFILLRMLSRRVGPIVDSAVVSSWARTAGVTIATSVAVFVLTKFVRVDSPRWSQSLMELALLVSGGGIVAIAMSLALKMPELRWALGKADSLK